MAYLKDLGEKRKLAAQETTEEATDSAGSWCEGSSKCQYLKAQGSNPIALVCIC